MKCKTLILLAALVSPVLFLADRAWCETAAAAAAPAKLLLDPAAAGSEKQVTPQGPEKQIAIARTTDPAVPGIAVTIAPGASEYPGVSVKPDGAAKWDLSAHGHVEARITNTGNKPLGISLRVDNAGDWRDSPWNCESPITIKPGETGTASVIFGHGFGRMPSFPLKPEAVTNILLFTSKATEEKSFRIESITAAGPAGEKPPLNPKTVRVKPKDGIILGPGASSDVTVEVGRNSVPWRTARAGDPLPDVSLQIDAKGSAKGSIESSAVKAVFPAGEGEQSVSLMPATGSWDLRRGTEMRVKVKNDGKTPVTPNIQLFSGGGPASPATAAEPLAPGALLEMVVPFAAAAPTVGYYPSKLYSSAVEKGTGTTFTSDVAGPIKISAAHEGDASLLIESITCEAPAAKIPEWLGKRPPVEGDWVKTFDDGFDGNAIDLTKWNIHGPNFWDKRTHWTKDNLIVKDGMAIQRFGKKTGFHNDDPAQKETEYACGFLDTYGKWVQRYGYFEARVKLPDASGLWPTFWLMPDRGVEAGPQWKRQATEDGAMELDIMEHLTRWGPHRYNIANHWDGYGKNHMANGSTCNYVQPDKDGFITCGLLWTPGSLVYYCNGQEMFRWENGRVGSVPCEIILETTTGGWENNSVDDKQLPVDYLVDYVRVWQRKDLASPADGYKLPESDRTQNGWFPPATPSPSPAPAAK